MAAALGLFFFVFQPVFFIRRRMSLIALCLFIGGLSSFRLDLCFAAPLFRLST
jgi:hypothetical protein